MKIGDVVVKIMQTLLIKDISQKKHITPKFVL